MDNINSQHAYLIEIGEFRNSSTLDNCKGKKNQSPRCNEDEHDTNNWIQHSDIENWRWMIYVSGHLLKLQF